MTNNTYLISAPETLMVLDYDTIQGSLPIFLHSSQAVCSSIMTLTAFHHGSNGQVSVYETTVPVQFHSPFTSRANWGGPIPEPPSNPKALSEKLAQGLGLPYSCQITPESTSPRLVFEKIRQSSSDVFPSLMSMSLPIMPEIDWTPYQLAMVRLLEEFYRQTPGSYMPLDQANRFHQQALDSADSWHYYIHSVECQERNQALQQAWMASQQQLQALQSSQLPVLTIQEVQELIGPIRAEATLDPFSAGQEPDHQSQTSHVNGWNDLDPPEDN